MRCCVALLAAATAGAAVLTAAPTPSGAQSFRLGGRDLNAFELDGEQFRFMAGSMHGNFDNVLGQFLRPLPPSRCGLLY